MSPPPPLPNHPSVTSTLISPLPTPHWGAQPSPAFTVRATTTISASPSLILSSLLDTSTWPQWNNFVPSATVHPFPASSSSNNDDNNNNNNNNNNSKLQPGILFTEHVSMRGRGRSSIVKQRMLMTTLEEISDDGRRGWRAVWLGKMYPDWALRSERVHEIYERDGEEGTVYDCYETLSGPLAWAVRVFVGGVLVRRFGQWDGELKGFVEGMGEGRERGG